MNLRGKRVLFCAFCAFLLVWTATAQDGGGDAGTDPGDAPEATPAPTPEVEPAPEVEPDPHGGVPVGPPSGGDAIEAEMREIFRRVETKLREIDVLLSDAGAGDTRRLREADAAGIDELLRRSIDEGRDVQREIDQLLRLAQQAGQQSSSPSSGSGQQQGQGQGEGQQQSGTPSPLDGSQGGGGRQEATPSLPEQVRPDGGGDQPRNEPDGQQPGGDQGEQPGGKEPKPGDGENPEDGPSREDDDPRNIEGDGPRPDETDAPPSRGDLSERWGELPVHVRDVFRTEGGEDMPAEYRDWIDAYYKKLNERAGSSR